MQYHYYFFFLHATMMKVTNNRYTENVVDFMVNKLRKLSPQVQHALQLAACLGNTFTVTMLSTVSQLSYEEVENCLVAVISNGLIFTFSESQIVAKNVVRTDYYKYTSSYVVFVYN